MKPLSRQVFIWLIVIIGTASLYGAVYHWVKVKIDLPPPDKRALVLIDLNQLTPTPNVVSALEKEIPPPEPEIEKEQEQDLPPLPEPPPKTLPKKELEPEPQPHPEAAIQQKKLEDEAQRLAELRRKREKAQQAIEAKRRRQAEQLRIEANQKKQKRIVRSSKLKSRQNRQQFTVQNRNILNLPSVRGTKEQSSLSLRLIEKGLSPQCVFQKRAVTQHLIRLL